MKGKSRAMIEQIQKMYADRHGIKKIALALGISKNTVRRYLRLETAVNEKSATVDDTASVFDWDQAAKEAMQGRPLKRIFEEMAPAMSYSHFTRKLKPLLNKTPAVAIRLNHMFGENTQVDYAEGLSIVDPVSGKETKTQFFCGVLPASSYTFGEFSLSQKLSSFIRSHEAMWGYFGGISQYVVLDNLKSGVTKAHRYDPEINPTYCDYANHAGFAVLPARIRTPRDKASVEATFSPSSNRS